MESEAFAAVMYFFYLALYSNSAAVLTPIVNASGQVFVAFYLYWDNQNSLG